MKLVVVSNPVEVAHEHEIINDLFSSGLKYFHLRKPVYSRREMITLLGKINLAHYSKISLHQFHETAADLGINRLHFSEKLRKETSEQRFDQHSENEFKLSTSIHHLSDLEDLSRFDYTFYGPVFDSVSKPGYKSVIESDFKLKKIRGLDIIALGGINATNIDRIKTMNFGGAAVLGTIWKEPKDALKNFNILTTAILNDDHR